MRTKNVRINKSICRSKTRASTLSISLTLENGINEFHELLEQAKEKKQLLLKKVQKYSALKKSKNQPKTIVKSDLYKAFQVVMEDYELDITEVMKNRIKLKWNKNDKVTHMLLQYIAFMENIDLSFTTVKRREALEDLPQILTTLERISEKERELIMNHKELSSQIDTYTDRVENEKNSLALTMKRNAKLLERSKLLTTRLKVNQLRKQSEMKRFSKGKAEKKEEYDVLREPLIESYLQWTSTAMAKGPIEEAFMTEDRMDDVSTFELLGFMEVVAKKIALYKKEHDEKKEGT